MLLEICRPHPVVETVFLVIFEVVGDFEAAYTWIIHIRWSSENFIFTFAIFFEFKIYQFKAKVQISD